MALVVSKTAIVFIYMAIGYALCKAKIIAYESKDYFMRLIIVLTSPCLLVSSILGNEVHEGMMLKSIIAIVLSLVIFSAGGILAMIIMRKKGIKAANELSVAMSASNSGFIGIPITMAVFNDTVLYYLVMGNISLNLYLFTVALYQLKYGHSTKSQEHATLWQRIKPVFQPVTVAAVGSAILLFAGFRMPDYPMQIIETIGDITIPLSMITVGIQLAGANLIDIIRNKDLYLTSAVKLIVIPAITLGIVMLMGMGDEFSAGMVMNMVFPTAVFTVVLTSFYGGDGDMMSEAVAQTTLLSIFSITAWIILLSHMYPSVM